MESKKDLRLTKMDGKQVFWLWLIVILCGYHLFLIMSIVSMLGGK